jgi:TolA-binding protein
MPIVHRLYGILLLLGIAGFTALALAQDAPDNATPPDAAAPSPASTSATPSGDADLAAQVEQLRTEIDALKRQIARLTSAVEQLQTDREPQASEAAAPKASPKKRKTTAALTPAPAPAPVEPEVSTPPTTILVFHDGHKVEAQNYAIVGQSLWIYTADDSKKVPLADLDVAATKNANSDRGVTFQVPPTAPAK